jgi:hypothetical protein
MAWAIAALAVAGLFWLTWRGGMAAPGGYLFGMASAEEEAAYCLAVAERASEITQGRGEARLERHLDEQIEFWRGRKGDAMARGRAALARDSGAPGVNEGAHLHLAVQDCGHRAIALYGHRFLSIE